jgi:hypothetical protein
LGQYVVATKKALPATPRDLLFWSPGERVKRLLPLLLVHLPDLGREQERAHGAEEDPDDEAKHPAEVIAGVLHFLPSLETQRGACHTSGCTELMRKLALPGVGAPGLQ